MISVAKENFKNAQAAGDPNASFRLTNDDDPTERLLPRTVAARRRPGELEDSLVNEGAADGGAYLEYGAVRDGASDDAAADGVTYGRGEGRIHLSSVQLQQIENAKRKAGVK